MARKIIWSRRSQEDRKSIVNYWTKRNKSNAYSKKLNQMFIQATELLSTHPQVGRLTNRERIRVKFIKHFALIYESNDNELHVLTIFDTRQNPDKLEKILKQ